MYIFFPWTTGAAAGQHSSFPYIRISVHSRYKSSLAPWACVFVVVEKLCACQNASHLPAARVYINCFTLAIYILYSLLIGGTIPGPGTHYLYPLSLSLSVLCVN